MSLFNFPPTPRVGSPAPAPPPATPPASAPAGGAAAPEFGRVLDFQAARASRAEPIPDAVLEDVQRAHELVERLAFEGRHVRFETHSLSGQIVAGLCDEKGAVIKQLSLTDVVLGHLPDEVA